LFALALQQVLAEVRESRASQQVYVLIPADNSPAWQAAEQLGFEYQRSIFFTRFLGSIR
jgi:hypothetical protein